MGALAGAMFAAAPARADDPSGEPLDPRCEGTHSLANPLPDECLGVIDTDRPHQTDTPHVVAAGHVQIESALAALQLGGGVSAPGKAGAAAAGDRNAHLLLLDDNYKFGPVTGVDVQIIFTHAAYVPATGKLLSPGPLQLRAKLHVVEEDGWVPSLSVVPWVFLPVSSSEPLRGGPLVFWGWELPAHFELEMNAGALFGCSPTPPAALVLASALTYTIIDDFRVFADIYAIGPDVALGTGALWAFTRDMQIDLGTYVGLNGDEPMATPFLGFSIRR
jgi:hypothetical protein